MESYILRHSALWVPFTDYTGAREVFNGEWFSFPILSTGDGHSRSAMIYKQGGLN